MKNMRKFNGKRVLSTLLCLILTVTMLVSTMPVAKALEPIRLAENEMDEAIVNTGAFYLATTNATLSENQPASYYLRVARGGENLPEASLKLEMIDVTAKFGEDYTIEVLHENADVQNTENSISIMEALSGDDVEQDMYDDYGNDLSMTDEAAKYLYEQNSQAMNEASAEAWDGYVREKASEDGIDPGVFDTDTEDKDAPQSELSLAFEEQTGLVDDRTPITVSSDSSELGDILEAGYGLDALNEIAEEIEAPSIILEFAEGETEKIIVINTKNNTVGEGNKSTMAKLVKVSDNAVIADGYSALNITIEDDEEWERPTVSFAEDSFTPEGGYAKVTIKRDGLSTMISSVHLTSADGTAVAGRDYSEVDTEIVFPYGVDERMVKIPIGSDSLENGGEFTLTLSDPADCDTGAAETTVVIPKGAESYNPKDLAEVGAKVPASAAVRVDAPSIDVTKTSSLYTSGSGSGNKSDAYVENGYIVLHPDSSGTASQFGWAVAQWAIDNHYAYSGFKIRWKKDGATNSYGCKNDVIFYPSSENKVGNSVVSWDEKSEDFFSDNAKINKIHIASRQEGGSLSASTRMYIYEITPVYRPFEITLEDADTSALQFVDESGKLVSYDKIAIFADAAKTSLEAGVNWAATGKNDVTVKLKDNTYSWIKHLDVVKYDDKGKIIATKRVVSNLSQSTSTASFQLTQDTLNSLGDAGFINFEKNGNMGLKGKIGVRAVLAPYPAEFTVKNDDVRATIKLIEPENKPAGWTWHKGDCLIAQTVVNKGYEKLWLPIGVNAHYKLSSDDKVMTHDTWDNVEEESYVSRQLKYAVLEIEPALEEYLNKLIVKVSSRNRNQYDRTKGIFKEAKLITKADANIDSSETGYFYYLIADTDTIIPNKYYELNVKPTRANYVAGWKQDVGTTEYYENTHYFRTTIKRAENIIELLAPLPSDTKLILSGTAYYSGATLDQRVEGEAWIPAEGAIASVDNLHYSVADENGNFAVKSTSGTDDNGDSFDYPLYAVKGKAFSYRITASGTTDYYKSKVDGTEKNGETTVNIGTAKVSAIDRSSPYIVSAIAINPDGLQTSQVPITDNGISQIRVVVRNCGAEYGDGLTENTKEVEVLAFHPKNAEPMLLAKASKDGYKATNDDEEDIPAYSPKVDGDAETWELRFAANTEDGYCSGDKIYVRLTTDRHEYKVYDENGKEVKDSAFNYTTYPPLDTGNVLVQPAWTVPDKYDLDILDDPEFMSDHLKFPIFGSMNAVFKAGNIVFSMKPLPNNGLRVSFGYIPDKLYKHTENEGQSDTGEDYSILNPLSSAKKAWADKGAFDKIIAKNAGQNNGSGKLLPIKSGSVGVMFGIYLDFGRICTAEGESLELSGGGVFGGVVATFRLVCYFSVLAVPVYFGFNVQFDAMLSLGVEKDVNPNDIPFEWDDVEVGFDADIMGHTLFEAYVGVGICGVIGARGGVSVNLAYEYWPTVADHYKKDDQLLKDHGHPDGLRSAGLQGKVSLKLWIDFLVKVAVYEYNLVNEDKDKPYNMGYYKDLEYLEEIDKELKKDLAATGASAQEEEELTMTTQFKQAGDPSVWTGPSRVLLRSTFEQESDVEIKTGGYDHADPQLFDLGDGKILLVYVDEDSSISGIDRTVLRYQVYDKNKKIWLATPGVIQAKNGDTNVNGALEPKLTDAGDKVMITWTAVVLPDADMSDADYMQKYLRQRNVYAAVVDKADLKSANSTEPAQIDGTLVSSTDKNLYNSSPVGVYYKDGDNEYLAVTYLASEANVTDDSLSSDEKEIMMAMNATNNSYVRTAQYDAKNNKWVTEFSVLKLNSTYDAKTKTWSPIDGSDGLMTDNNPTVIDLDTTVWGDWLISTFVVDEDNDISTDEDREVFVKFENLKTGNATVNQLTDDGEYIDTEGNTHVGTAKSRPQLVKTSQSVFLFWQNGTNDVAWIDLGYVLADGITDLDTGRIVNTDKASRRFIFYPTVGVDIDPTYAGFRPFVDERGNLYVVWQQGIKENGILKQELYAQSMIRDEEDELSPSWSDPIRLTYTEAREGYGSVYNDEPAIMALGSGELLVVCNRFGSSEDPSDITALDLSMHGVRFVTKASVKPIDLESANEYPAPGEEFEFDVTVKNDGLKTANGFVVVLRMIEKDQYDENIDYSKDSYSEGYSQVLFALADFDDVKLNPSEITTVHINEDNAFFVISEATNDKFSMPDKLAENGYVIIPLALEYDSYDKNNMLFDNAPYKAFEDVVKVDPSYTVHVNADTYRGETGSLGSEDFIFHATVSADGNIPMRDTDRLVVGPANLDNVGGVKDTGYYLDVPLSKLDISETDGVKTITSDLKISPERFTYGYTTLYAEIVDKDDNTISDTQGFIIETPAPYSVTVKDKNTDKVFNGEINLEPSESVTLSGSYEPSTHFRDGKVVYSIADTNVATVDENGVITAVAAGTTTLYASVDIYDAVREYTVTVSEDIYILGDANGDGEVNIVDATAIQQYIAGLPVVDTFSINAADVDGDNTVTIVDATNIQRYLAGLSAPSGIGTKKRILTE